MATFTIPPDNKTAGEGGFVADINNAYAALAAVAGYNVLDAAYGGGADSSGVADSTAAINAAIAAAQGAGGGAVYFPPGTYLVSSPLLLSGGYPGALQVIGAGWNSQIKLANGSNCFMFDFGAPPAAPSTPPAPCSPTSTSTATGATSRGPRAASTPGAACTGSTTTCGSTSR